jgi:hypothetical protein
MPWLRSNPGPFSVRNNRSALGFSWELKEFDLKYRDVEYTVMQGIERQLWKWSFSMNASVRTGQAATKAEAVKEAERAIDRTLDPKKLKLIRPARD